METNHRQIYITDSDMRRLRALLASHDLQNGVYKNLLQNLKFELDRAVVVSSEAIPDNVVTMNSQTVLSDLNTGEKLVCSLVFPGNADFDKNRISIFAPVGTAILGCKVKDIVDFKVPSGRTQLQIDEILYQPEAVGDYHL